MDFNNRGGYSESVTCQIEQRESGREGDLGKSMETAEEKSLSGLTTFSQGK